MTQKMYLFQQLIKKYKDSYIDYLEKQNLESGLLEKIKKNLTDWKNPNSWKQILIHMDSIKDLKKIANPYFIGYGNPESNILFIGQEKAFDIIQSTSLLFHESVYNPIQWKHILDKETEKQESPNLYFDPRFPQKYFKKEAKGRGWQSHTWNKYSILISFLLDENISSRSLFQESENIEKSFFNYCFCTEYNHVPSKRTKNENIISVRKEFLKNAFFKSFKHVFFAVGSSLKKDKDQVIAEIFNAEKIDSNFELGKYGKGKTRTVSIYKSNQQTIIVCNQLSGSASWKDENLKKMIEVFK